MSALLVLECDFFFYFLFPFLYLVTHTYIHRYVRMYVKYSVYLSLAFYCKMSACLFSTWILNLMEWWHKNYHKFLQWTGFFSLFFPPSITLKSKLYFNLVFQQNNMTNNFPFKWWHFLCYAYVTYFWFI